MRQCLTPHSLSALAENGVEINDIVEKSRDFYKNKFPDIANNNELLNMAYDHYDKKRKLLLQQCQKIRNLSIKRNKDVTTKKQKKKKKVTQTNYNNKKKLMKKKMKKKKEEEEEEVQLTKKEMNYNN